MAQYELRGLDSGPHDDDFDPIDWYLAHGVPVSGVAGCVKRATPDQVDLLQLRVAVMRSCRPETCVHGLNAPTETADRFVHGVVGDHLVVLRDAHVEELARFTAREPAWRDVRVRDFFDPEEPCPSGLPRSSFDQNAEALASMLGNYEGFVPTRYDDGEYADVLDDGVRYFSPHLHIIEHLALRTRGIAEVRGVNYRLDPFATACRMGNPEAMSDAAGGLDGADAGENAARKLYLALPHVERRPLADEPIGPEFLDRLPRDRRAWPYSPFRPFCDDRWSIDRVGRHMRLYAPEGASTFATVGRDRSLVLDRARHDDLVRALEGAGLDCVHDPDRLERAFRGPDGRYPPTWPD